MRQFLYFYPLTLAIFFTGIWIISWETISVSFKKNLENFFGKMQSVKYIDK